MTPPTPQPPTPELPTPEWPEAGLLGAGLSETALPSGRQYTIAHGAERATVVQAGGGLRSYIADGRELLDGYAEDQMASSARGQPLIPWPNRLRDGQYTWDGQTHQTRLGDPAPPRRHRAEASAQPGRQRHRTTHNRRSA